MQHVPVCTGNRSTCLKNVDVVFQRNEEFAVRHRRSSEPAIQQQAFWHQFLDCEHLVLVSDLAESVLEFVRLVDERPQDVVELLRVFGSISFTAVAD